MMSNNWKADKEDEKINRESLKKINPTLMKY